MVKKTETWITLKEAAKISGYSPDYIGELIRKGKIPGKQVVCNVAWLTTKEAILEYKEKQAKEKKKKLGKKEKFLEFLREIKGKILLHFEILKFFLKTFRTFFIILLILILFLAGVFSFLFFSVQKKEFQQEIFQPEIKKIETPTF